MVAQYCRLSSYDFNTIKSGYLCSVFQHWFLRVLDEAERGGDLINVTNRFWSSTDFCKTTIMIFCIFNSNYNFLQQHRDFASLSISKTAILQKYLQWKIVLLKMYQKAENHLLLITLSVLLLWSTFCFQITLFWLTSNSNSWVGYHLALVAIVAVIMSINSNHIILCKK